MQRFIYLLLCLPFSLFAQENTWLDGSALGINYLGGKILMHTPKIYVEAPPYSSAIEVSYTKQTLGNKPWHQKFGFPEAAVNFCYSMNGSSELGNAIAIYPSIQFKILGNTKLHWFGKVGGGLGFINQRWQRTPTTDSMNNIIGSKLNNFSMFQTGIRYKVDKHWSAQLGLHFYHLSNAAARSPNFGINTFGLHAGIHYFPNGIMDNFIKQEQIKIKNALHVGLSSTIAFAEAKTPDGPLYRIVSLTVQGAKMYRNKNRILFGSDVIYSSKSRAFIHSTQQTKNGKLITPWQYTAFIGHEFLFGRTGFPVYAGAYVTRPIGGEKIYQKVGITYHFYRSPQQFAKDMYAALILKTHLVQAQYAELGIGVLF
ncbi:MAG: acyloxyacyl hydrolase [Bacteroidetes bacterium]|nr:acyloxyacyl hydrolase [Bacteroidota bacterium]